VSALAAATAEEVQEAIREHGPLIPVAGGTKPATHGAASGEAEGRADCSLSRPGRDKEQSTQALDVSGLAGVVDYDPAELTFVARPGTPLAEIEAMLGASGQHLPFDPPRLGSGDGTLGGAVATGVTGPGGFGAGVRDFVIGVRFVDGTGRLVGGGGRVVKNAAGFDLPKLLVGSMGRLGTIVELALKVFPRPAAHATVRFETGSFAAGLGAVATLARGPVPPVALDLAGDGTISARIGGGADLIGPRAERLAGLLDAPAERLADDAEEAHWEEARRFAWLAPGERLAVVPLTPATALALEPELDRLGASRRYGLGANVVWLGWPGERPLDPLADLLAARGLAAAVLTGPPLAEPLIGAPTANAFTARVAAAIAARTPTAGAAA
jgi:glycolate oxidase FAD binding subunit